MLLAGTFVGNQSVLVRLSFGIDAGNQVGAAANECVSSHNDVKSHLSDVV